MNEREKIAAWRRPTLEASMWWCGDDDCDCWQPQIDRLTPNFKGGYPWIHREEVWRGDFHSQPEASEWAAQLQQLRDAAAQHGVPLTEEDDHTPYGRIAESEIVGVVPVEKQP